MRKFFIIFVLAFLAMAIINYYTNRHITVVFKDVRPFEGKIPVYYKGVVVGKATDRQHSDDSLRTNVKITIYNKKLKLPLNTKAILKKRIKNDKEFDYIELVYPQIPSERFIGEHSHIRGHHTVDIKEYLKNQTPEDLEQVKNNILSASENLNASLDALAGMFLIIQDVIGENRENLKNASYNLNQTAQNINNATKKIDNVIEEERLSNTFNNIENTTLGLHNLMHNANGTVDGVNHTLPDTLQNTNEITANVNAITCGLRQTLSKNFGGLRLFFGKVIE